jgi:hypothetical protein
MKILFLDHDGVMVPIWGGGSDCAMKKDNQWDAEPFSAKAVAILNNILLQTGAKIVVSSDWRNHYTLQEMRDIYAANGVIRGPIGYTINSLKYRGDNLEGGRTEEILEWVNRHRIEHWVAIDDLDMFELGQHFVHCKKPQAGIKATGVKEKILQALEKNSNHVKGYISPIPEKE